MTKISVIIPVYNTEKWVEKSIRSVQNGGYDNIEIIIVNDGSPDNSAEIIDKLAKQDSRIIHLQKKNGGLPAARQSGIDISTGDYIFFVDSDDYIAPNSLSKMMTIAQNTSADMVYCDAMLTYEDDKKNKPLIMNPEHKDTSNGLKYMRAEIENYMCMKLFRAEVIRNIKQQLSQVCEDTYAMVQVLPRCNKIVYLNEPLYYYLQTTQSIMRTSRQRAVGEWLRHGLHMIELIPTLSLPKDIQAIFFYRNIHTIHRFFKEGDKNNILYMNLAIELIRKSYSTIQFSSINTFHRLKLILYLIVTNIRYGKL